MKKYSSTKKGSFRLNSNKRKFGLITFLFLVIFLGIFFPWLISRLSSIVLYPIHVTTNWIKTADTPIPLFFRSRGALIDEIDNLRASIASSAGTESSIKRLLEQNTQLRTLLNDSNEDSRIMAQVLSRPGILPYDLMQIDKGSNQGIVIGAPVFTGLDSLVGIVTQVFPEYAFVDLFTSPGFLSTAYIFGPDIMAPIEGVGGGIARVKLPQGVNIQEGQLVILPGVSDALFGEIIVVQNEPSQTEQYGYIAPPTSLNNLLYVSVNRKPVNNAEPIILDEVIRKINQKRTIVENYEIATSTVFSPEAVEETVNN